MNWNHSALRLVIVEECLPQPGLLKCFESKPAVLYLTRLRRGKFLPHCGTVAPRLSICSLWQPCSLFLTHRCDRWSSDARSPALSRCQYHGKHLKQDSTKIAVLTWKFLGSVMEHACTRTRPELQTSTHSVQWRILRTRKV